MLLYSQPEFLTTKDHGSLCLDESEKPFEFAKNIRAIPITAVEVASAQRHYPVVFSDLEQPSLLAVVGVFEDRNLFVDDNGQWDEYAYIPAYVRCHPFAAVKRPDNQFAVAIDRSASSITQHAGTPLFDGAELSESIQSRADFCVQFNEHLDSTNLMCKKLVDLEVLSIQEASFAPTEGSDQKQLLGSYVAVDFDKLKELDSSVLRQLFDDGTLATIFAHRLSLDLWLQLLNRRNRLRSGD